MYSIHGHIFEIQARNIRQRQTDGKTDRQTDAYLTNVNNGVFVSCKQKSALECIAIMD